MHIEIISKDARQTILESNAAIWKMHSQQFRKSMVIQFLFGLIFIVPGILDFNGYDRMSTNDKTTYFNLNIFLSIGIAYYLFVLLRLYKSIGSKKKFLKNAEENAQRQTYGFNEMTTIINEDTITRATASMKQEIKWVLLSNYKLFDGILFLYSIDHISITLDKRLFNENDFSQLLVFINGRLLEKK